jgi:hypothetical protein
MNLRKEDKMRLRKYLIVGASIFIVMIFWGGNVAAYDMAEYCPLNQGDEWIYINNYRGDGRLPVKKVVDGTELVNGVETIKFGGCCYVMDSEGLKQYKQGVPGDNYLIFDPPRIIFPAQFDVGETYLYSVSAQVYSSDDTLTDIYPGNDTVILGNVRDVTVPAGTFKDCLKIYTYSSLFLGHYGGTITTKWYARNIGLIKSKEYEGSVVNVLISATVDGVHYGCPATFVLGGDSNDLNTLRKFRDEVLRKTPVGQEIIKLYYELSPVIVKAMAEDKEFKEEVKDMIEEVLPLVRKAVE